jgi:hypothetical protein
MTELAKIVKYSNESGGLNFQPFPLTDTDPTAGNEYDAATISSIAFGIFMALLALYSIWQYSRQYTGRLYHQFEAIRRLIRTYIVFIGHILQQHRNDTNSPENRDIEIGTIDLSSRK